MLLVDNPDILETSLPGFLLPSLPRDPAAVRAVRLSPFDGALWRSLADAPHPGLAAEGLPDFPGAGFWSSYHIVSRAPVSQYDVLRRLISEQRDLPGHVVCLALAGDGFHGQDGRSWQARAGNIHLSVGLVCDLDARATGLALTMLPAVAVMDVLRGLDPDGHLADPGIKWVNDILVGGKKLGGVLSSVRSLDGRIRSAVLGIGLNVENAPPVAPTPFTPGVTSLAEHLPRSAAGLVPVLIRLLGALAVRFGELEQEGPGPLLRDYRSFSLVLGRDCEIRADAPGCAPVRRGRVTAIAPDLTLTLDDGPEPVAAGRLVMLESGSSTAD